MRSKYFSTALAIMTMVVPAASLAADTVGTVASGSNALVARDGKVVPAVAGMPLYRGDRVITRADGKANVQVANGCTLSVGAAAMLPVSATACARPSTISFDQKRSGYAGKSSAFASNNDFLWYAGGAALLGGVLYFVLRDKDNEPASP